MLNLLAIPLWAWIAAAAVVVVAVVLIVLLIVLSKKRKNNGGADSGAQTQYSGTEQDEAVDAEEQTEEAEEEESAQGSQKSAEKTAKKPANKVYHISKRKSDGMWQIKAAGAEKAIKLFRTQKEAIDYCKTLANNQDASIMIHKEDGSFRKLTY